MNKKSVSQSQSAIAALRKTWMTNSLFSTGIALLVMIILQTFALGFQFDSFGDWFNTWLSNWINILRNNSGIGIISLGMTLVIISGGIDGKVGTDDDIKVYY